MQSPQSYTTNSPDEASVISSTLNPTKGFHTTSTTRFAVRGSRSHSCTLHLHFRLPAQLFVDPYELAHRQASYTFERFGGGNLEAPVFAPAAGGPSTLLLDLIIPESVDNVDQGDGNVFSVEVPLHARYGVPKSGGELMDKVVLPPPTAFWACPHQSASGSGGTPWHSIPLVTNGIQFSLPTTCFPWVTTMYSKTDAGARCTTRRRRPRTRTQRRSIDACLDSTCRFGARTDAPRTGWRCRRCGPGGDWHSCSDITCFCVSLADNCAGITLPAYIGENKRRVRKLIER